MVLADDYPVLGAFWTLLMFAGFVIWLFLAFSVIGDLFRRHDIGGWGKALWIVAIVILPYIGVLIYLIAEHQGMTERTIAAQQESKAAFDSYIQETAGAGNTGASELAKAKELRDSGALTEDEFAALKSKILA